jgi:hypothetical protein
MPGPGLDDYTVRLRQWEGHGPAAVWAITRHGEIRVAFMTRGLALATAAAMAQRDGCYAWLLVAGAQPELLVPCEISDPPTTRR